MSHGLPIFFLALAGLLESRRLQESREKAIWDLWLGRGDGACHTLLVLPAELGTPPP